jgi:hypothetical protein
MNVTSELGGSVEVTFSTENFVEGEEFKILVDGVTKFRTGKPKIN